MVLISMCSLKMNKTFIKNEQKITMLSKIFSRKQREEILSYILDHPSGNYRVREIAKRFKVSVGSVSQFFALLKRKGILKRRGDIFSVNLNNPLVKTIKILLNVSRLDIAPLKRIPDLMGIGLYGSWADGTNNEDSDIDIWVRVEKKPAEDIIARASRRMIERMRRNVQLLIVDPVKNRMLRENDPIFYYSLVYGSVVLYGKSLQD